MYDQNYFGNASNELIVLSFQTFLPSKTTSPVWGLLEHLWWWLLWCIERCIDSFLIIFFYKLYCNLLFFLFYCYFSSKPLLSSDTLQSIQETGNSDLGSSEFIGSSENTLSENIVNNCFNSSCLHSNSILYFFPPSWLLELSIQFDNDIYMITTVKHYY